MTAPHLSSTPNTTASMNTWRGEGPHPGMLASNPHSNESKVLSLDRAALILREYLIYDARNSQQMCGFIAGYPWVLEDPSICLVIVSDPKCYNTLKQYNWWDQTLRHVELPESLPEVWLKNNHILALAYETSDAQLEQFIDWPAWETLIQEHGPLDQLYDGDPEPFYRTRAFVVLANRLDTNLAPLMCAAMHMLMPFDALQALVGDAWTPLRKAQFAWFVEKTEAMRDIWRIPRTEKSLLAQAQKDIGQWQSLVHPTELMGLSVFYDLNNGDLDATMYDLIQFVQSNASNDCLDYTVALEPNKP